MYIYGVMYIYVHDVTACMFMKHIVKLIRLLSNQSSIIIYIKKA